MKSIRLLPESDLIVTSTVDHAKWNYRGWLGWLQRTRFRLLLSLMKNDRPVRLLEVGYGSGVFMPELATRCTELFGIDPHSRHELVTGILAHRGVKANLASGTVTKLPYADTFFDCAVSVSALEYVENVDAACRELGRVLTPTGALILVTPGHSRLLDVALKLITGEDAADNYAGRRERLISALLNHFHLQDERNFPPVIGPLLPVYRALRLVKR